MPIIRKPYRRHAAVTPLELRGAIDMLGGAMTAVTRSAITDRAQYRGADKWRIKGDQDAYGILADARLEVTRQLESM